MNVQDAKKIQIPEGEVRAIHDKDSRLLWGRLEYDTKYEGNASQQAYTGKNLVYVEDGTRTSVGCDITVSGDIMSAVGTNTSSPVIFYTYSLATPLAAGTYTLSIAEPISFQFKITLRYDNNTNKDVSINAGQTSATITTTRDVIRMTSCLGSVPVGTQVNVTMRKPQFEAGSTATAYESYVGGIPAPNPDYPQDIKVVEGPQQVTVYAPYHSKTYSFDLRGVNMFNKNATVVFSNSTTITALDTGVRATVSQNTTGVAMAGFIIGNASDYVGKTLTIKSNMTNTSGTSPRVYLGLSANNGSDRSVKASLFASGEASWTVAEDANRPKLLIVVYAAAVAEGASAGEYCDYTDLQVEVNFTSTDYQPYHAPYELARLGDYKDYIWKDGADWKLRKIIKKINVADIAAASYAYSNGCFQAATSVTADKEPSTVSMSDFFTFNPVRSGITGALANGEFGFNTVEQLTIKNTALTSKGDWTTWLSSHSPTAYYVLATATDSVITDAVLIAQLNAMQEWLTRYGYDHTVVGDLPIVINQESL